MTETIVNVVCARRLRWFGHVVNRPELMPTLNKISQPESQDGLTTENGEAAHSQPASEGQRTESQFLKLCPFVHYHGTHMFIHIFKIYPTGHLLPWIVTRKINKKVGLFTVLDTLF